MTEPGRRGVGVGAPDKARLLRLAVERSPRWITASGSSMGRSVPTGSSVLVVAATAPRRGEVWAVCDGAGRVVVHRYRQRQAAGHVLQGDTCVRPDAPVDDASLIGRVVAVRRRGRVRPLGARDAIVGALQRAPRAVVAKAARGLRRLRPSR